MVSELCFFLAKFLEILTTGSSKVIGVNFSRNCATLHLTGFYR